MVEDAADAVIRVDAVIICGTDPHIIGGDVPEAPEVPEVLPEVSEVPPGGLPHNEIITPAQP
ncbi:hypothetical protein ACWGRV_00245 [Streptomyces sp. NPDC055663]